MSTIDLSTAEIETIYVAYEQVLGLEAKTIIGKRGIVRPLYEAVIRARVQTAITAEQSPRAGSQDDWTTTPGSGSIWIEPRREPARPETAGSASRPAATPSCPESEGDGAGEPPLVRHAPRGGAR